MTFHEPIILGRTGLRVGRLGIASGYGVPTAAIEEAFERGCNYFTWGTVIKGYKPQMRQALKNIVAKGQRDRLVLGMFTYAHNNFFTERLFVRGLKSAGLDHADVLILGYFSRRPSRRRDGDIPVRGGGEGSRDRRFHCHPLGQALQPEEDASGRKAADGRGLLSLRSFPPRGRRLPSGSEDGRADAREPSRPRRRAHERGRTRPDTPHRRPRPRPQAALTAGSGADGAVESTPFLSRPLTKIRGRA